MEQSMRYQQGPLAWILPQGFVCELAWEEGITLLRLVILAQSPPRTVQAGSRPVLSLSESLSLTSSGSATALPHPVHVAGDVVAAALLRMVGQLVLHVGVAAPVAAAAARAAAAVQRGLRLAAVHRVDDGVGERLVVLGKVSLLPPLLGAVDERAAHGRARAGRGVERRRRRGGGQRRGARARARRAGAAEGRGRAGRPSSGRWRKVLRGRSRRGVGLHRRGGRPLSPHGSLGRGRRGQWSGLDSGRVLLI